MKKEQSSVSNQKVILPNKELVGVEKKKDIDETSKLPEPTGWRILVLPFKQKEKRWRPFESRRTPLKVFETLCL